MITITDPTYTTLSDVYSDREEIIRESLYNSYNNNERTLFKIGGHAIQAGDAIVNSIVYRQVNDFFEDEEDFFNQGYMVELGTENSTSILNTYLERLFKRGTCVKDPENKRLKVIFEEIADLTMTVNRISGQSVSLFALFQAIQENPDLENIINYQLNEGDRKTLKTLIDTYDNQYKALVNGLKDEKVNSFNPWKSFLNSGVAINPSQLGQMLVSVGLKPDLSGIIIPEPIEEALVNGFQEWKSFFINALGSRKAQVTNALTVSEAGYVSRKFEILLISKVFTHAEKCNSRHGYITTIQNQNHLDVLSGRYLVNDHSMITEDRVELIGTEVEIHSPMTCNSSVLRKEVYLSAAENYQIRSWQQLNDRLSFLWDNPEKVMIIESANVSHDELSKIPNIGGFIHLKGNDMTILVSSDEKNIDISKLPKHYKAESFVELDQEELLGDIFDSIGSLRHLVMQVYRINEYMLSGICQRCYGDEYNSDKKNFHPGMLAEKIYSNLLIQILLSTKHLLKCQLDEIDWPKVITDALELTGSDLIPHTPLTIKPIDVSFNNSNDPTFTSCIINEVEIELPHTIIIHESMYNDNNHPFMEDYEINLSPMDEDFLYVEIANSELSATMRRILKIIESKDHDGIGDDYNTIADVMRELLDEAGIGDDPVTVEVMVSGLIKAADGFSRVDWTQVEIEGKFVVHALSTAIANSSIAQLLAFERFRQFMRKLPDLKEPSQLDVVFSN